MKSRLFRFHTMKMIPSVVLQRFRQNKPILLWVPTPTYHEWFIEMAAINGYHGIWIDHQHQNYSDDQIAHMCLACRAGGIDPIIRVRKRDLGSYSRAFEMGGSGIIVPHVNTAAEARAIVRECKFPPDGNRGLDGVEPPARFGYIPGAEYVKQANQETCIIIQIEEPEAVENVEEIATVPGIDVLMIGPGDLTLRYGCYGQITEPEPWAAVERVAAAAKRNGKQWGLPVGTAELAEKYMDMGARFFAHGSVWGFVSSGFEQVKKTMGPLFDMRAQAEANQKRGY
jgi:4-hydroxy-2-oxoheptanedioate aldolase